MGVPKKRLRLAKSAETNHAGMEVPPRAVKVSDRLRLSLYGFVK